MTTFIETSALTSRKYVPDCHDRSKFITETSTFMVRLSLKYYLVASFSETCALSSRKYASDQAMSVPNLS